jgi:uncharacterized protein (TIGR03437 family)
MNRLARIFALSAFALVSVGSVCAQTSSFNVYTEPAGARFSVDGTEYTQAASFLWPKGSKHTLKFMGTFDAVTQVDPTGGTAYSFGGWADNLNLTAAGTDPVQVITADPAITSYVAKVTLTYRLYLNFLEGGGTNPTSPAKCGAPGDLASNVTRPGVVYLNGTCYWASTTVYLPAGNVSLNAYPYPGFVFTGWSLNFGANDSSLRSFVLNGPASIAPHFTPGKRVKFITQPLGLHVLVDRTDTPTADVLPCPPNQQQTSVVPGLTGNQTALCIGEFDFEPGSKHLIGANSPQLDKNGIAWIFDSWSIGGGQNTVYTTGPANTPETLVARFVPGVRVSFVTTPVPLKLIVDGRDNWSSLNFVWAAGSKYTVTAPETLTDASGRKYVFKNWSNGGSATQDVVVDAAAAASGSLRLVANYDLLNRAVIQSTAPGIVFKVDGNDCVSPCVLDRAAGSTAVIAAPASAPINDLSRYEFTVWQDGASRQRSVTFNANNQNVNANYRISNKLVGIVDPEDGAVLAYSPISVDGFYPSDATVTVTASSKPGFKFRRWDGDLDGVYNVGYVPMSTPKLVRALLAKVPYIAPAGVRNSAGDTPVSGVAAGSIISIYGASLANKFEVGSSSPLAQTLAGVVVLIGDRLLPLVYVSPEQINAQLPNDLDEGDYTVTVKNDGYPDVTGQLTVVRNAPGLFMNNINQKNFVLALHEDGTVITPDSPARRNEVVTVLGTGFGPYDKNVPEGFAAPVTPVSNVVDKTEISAGGVILQPTFAGAAPGFVGITATKFRLTRDLPGASSVDFKVMVNGRESNTALLPIE